MGSSLEVYPVAALPGGDPAAPAARWRSSPPGPTPYDDDAVVKLDGDVVDELDAVLAALPDRVIAEGDRAPDFTLPDQDGEEVTLSSLRGQKVVLYFYPTGQHARLHDAGLRRPRPLRRLRRP